VKVINKKHPEILQTKAKSECYLSVQQDRIWISHEAVKRFGLIAGMYLQFLNDEKAWWFFQSKDPDGFYLQENGHATSQALVISSKPLLRMILKSTGYKVGTRFYLLKPGTEYNGHQLIEVVTNKTFDQFMSAVL
jgi:hypothetical protein